MYIIAFISVINVLFIIYLYVIGTIKYGDVIKKLDKGAYPLKPFMQLGYYLITASDYKFTSKYDLKMLTWFNELYGRKIGKNKYKLFLVEKISLCFVILFIFSFVTIVTLFDDFSSIETFQNNSFYRDEEKDKIAKVMMKVEKDAEALEQEVVVTIPKKDETREEIEAKVEAVATEIKDYIESMGVIDKPLNLIEEYKDVKISWSTSDDNVMDHYGNIYNENIDSLGTKINLTAILEYKGYSEQFNIEVKVMPVKEVNSISINEIAKEIIENIDNGIYTKSDSLKLPTKLSEPEDVNVSWKQIHETDAINIFILGIALTLIIFFVIDENIKKKQQKKKLLIRLIFPDMIAKFTLLINAGLTTYGAWQKICDDYIKGVENGREENPLYDEMLVTLSDMKGGISEHLAYELFGNRVGVNEVKKFANILTQSIKRGNTDLIVSLRQLSTDAWETRLTAAKRLGEEAATKLLFPMMILLFVIIIIVITPAFMTMN